MKKITSITIEHRPDYDADLSYLGTFDKEAKSPFAIEHEPSNPRVFHWFNPQPGTCETKEDAQRVYERMMGYERGQRGMCSIRAIAKVQVSEDGKHWLSHEITSGGLYGIEDDMEREDYKEIEQEEISQLVLSLKEFGFTDEEIKAAKVENNAV